MPPLVKLDQDAADLWDAYVKAREAKSKAEGLARKANSKKQDAETLLLEALGENIKAQLPDGRVIFYVTKEQHRRPQPAKDVTWREWHQE